MEERLFSLIHPDAEVITCQGTLTTGSGLSMGGEFDVVFLLGIGPVIEMKRARHFSGVDLSLGSFDGGTFDGTSGNGAQVHCDSVFGQQLRFSSSSPLTALFLPQNVLTVGDAVDTSNVRRLCCRLYSYLGPNFDLTLAGIPIRYDFPPDDREKSKRWTLQWRMPVETGDLMVSDCSDVDDALLLADRLSILLTFLEGRYVSFCRYYVTDSKGNTAQVFMQRRAVKPGFYQEVLYTTPVQSVLSAIAPNFLSMVDTKRDQLSLAIAYLASAKSERQLEQQTIDLSVAWEILIDLISGKHTPLSAEIEELKCDLKGTVSTWRGKYPDADPHGKLAREVTKALYPDPFLSGIRKSMLLASVSEGKIGANADLFKDLRHLVVHEGKADRASVSLKEFHSVLWHMVFAADLVVLKHLDYCGPVYDRRLAGLSKHDIQMADLAP